MQIRVDTTNRTIANEDEKLIISVVHTVVKLKWYDDENRILPF